MSKETYWFIQKSKEVKKINFGYLYVIRFEHWFKVGITNNLTRRFNSLRFSMPTNDFEMIGFMTHTQNNKLENGILLDLVNYKTRGEWVNCSKDELMEVINHWSDIYNIKFHTSDGTR